MPEADSSPMLTILKELRADMRQQRTLLLQLAEAARRRDRRFDDLERALATSNGASATPAQRSS
jgi:hypothetical protein